MAKGINFKDYFKGKKITVMGLGVLGRGVNVAKFLAENGAKLTITDLKKKEELAPSLKQLKKFSNIKYVLGRHDVADFQNVDMVIKAAGVPLDSPYVAEARKNGVVIEMDASLFFKLAQGKVIIAGVTGTRGKSTITHLLYEIIKNSGRRVFLGGNIKGMATLPLLKKVKSGDIVVMELDSWQLQGFGEARISPSVAVFATFLADHMNYYKNNMARYFKDKVNIFKYQTRDNFLILGEKFLKGVKDSGLAEKFNVFKKQTAGKIIVAKKLLIPKDWKIKLVGEHNLENIAVAIAAAQCLSIKENVIKKTVEKFKGLTGRLEFIAEKNGVKYYNDTTATTPDGTMAGLRALKKYKNKIILIGGGADKGLDYKEYAEIVPKFIKALILFKGAASDKIIRTIGKTKFSVVIVTKMKDAVAKAREFSVKGDIILLSPAAASFGIFKNEFDRGEQFNRYGKQKHF